jgi:uncharacterized OB-fold protein
MSDAGYDEWLAALGTDEAFSLACENGHGSLPPRRVCPHCGSDDLSERPLPDTGTVETFSVLHVAAPTFKADLPYVTAVVDFGDVRLTGVLTDVDPDDVAVGDTVSVGRDVTETTGEDVVVFRPA